MPWRVGQRVLESKLAAWTVLAVLLLVLAVNVAVYQQSRDYPRCIGRWADQYTARAERITKVNADPIPPAPKFQCR